MMTEIPHRGLSGGKRSHDGDPTECLEGTRLSQEMDYRWGMTLIELIRIGKDDASRWKPLDSEALQPFL
jgi:hypothetical protein